MTPLRLFSILFITACTAAAWAVLGTALGVRTSQSQSSSAQMVAGGWGPPLQQSQPVAWHQVPGAKSGRQLIRPARSEVGVSLSYEPRRKGLLWHRSYGLAFRGRYEFANPAPIPQTIYVKFALPSDQAGYSEFTFTLNGKPTTADVSGREPIVEALTLEPAATATLEVGYKTRGMDRWTYSFDDESRVQNFLLRMDTNFAEVDFPTSSPTARRRTARGWDLEWAYADQIGARPVSIEMPKVLNPGPVAARITFFAPVSLIFFFGVLIVLCLIQRVDLHPMNFFFLAAGCFAFQLLFAYLVDLIPLTVAFLISAGVSLTLVSGYLLLARGLRFARLAALAQFAYMILFSYSFFFDGLAGLTITIGAIATLAILMASTARINWAERFSRRPLPPPIAQAAK